MTTTIERPPVTVDPPQLPPWLTGRPRRRDDGPIIMPDLPMHGISTKTRHDNFWTIHHFWMIRMWGFFDRVERTCVNTRLYRSWLETYPMPDGIPPHIQFGGAVVAGERDPTFHDRWKDYARRTFA